MKSSERTAPSGRSPTPTAPPPPRPPRAGPALDPDRDQLGAAVVAEPLHLTLGEPCRRTAIPLHRESFPVGLRSKSGAATRCKRGSGAGEVVRVDVLEELAELVDDLLLLLG